MYSYSEAKAIKKKFWTAFGKSFPRKWILYNTKIKDFSFKFTATPKKAEVSLDIEMADELFRNVYFEKMESLEIPLQDALGNYEKDEHYTLENGKTIARIWVSLEGKSIYNQEHWRDIFEFFVEKMSAFESIFNDYEEYIKDI